MRDTFLFRLLSDDERNMLYDMVEDDEESSYRAKIILLKDEGYPVPQIRMATNHHDINIRKWIHRFNEKGIDGIIPRKHKHKQLKISVDIETKIVEIASKNSRKLWTSFFYMVFKGTCRMRIKGTKPCGFYKSIQRLEISFLSTE